jgi:uncharacterized MAPEG superfamily protein
MTVELMYLTWVTLLTGLLWIPVVIGYVSARGVLTPADYVSPPESALPPWVNRAFRAHYNAIEGFVAFAVIIIIAHLAGISTQITQAAAMVYFWARLAHAVVHISGFKHFYARTMIFNVAFFAWLAIIIEVLRHG